MRSSAAAITIGLLGASCSGSENAPVTLVFETPDPIACAFDRLLAVRADGVLVGVGGAKSAPVAMSVTAASITGAFEAAAGRYELELSLSGEDPRHPGLRWSFGSTRSPRLDLPEAEGRGVLSLRPLDPTAAPDDDKDALPPLYEILLGADPSVADSDGDGFTDGKECDPGDAASSLGLTSGSLFDCDGDGFLAPDRFCGVPSEATSDCGDRDAAVFPGALDDCGTALDQDCDPSTCATLDLTPPVLDMYAASLGGDRLGCYSRLSVNVREEGSPLREVGIDLSSFGGASNAPLALEGDRWVSPPLNDLAPQGGLTAARSSLRVHATDSGPNTSQIIADFELVLDTPRITTFTPATVGAAKAPFQVELRSTGPEAGWRLSLLALPRVNGVYLRGSAVTVGTVAAPGGMIAVDPYSFELGDWLLVPMASDGYDNRLEPKAEPELLAGGEIESDNRCLGTPSPRLPARAMTIDDLPGFENETMKFYLSQAITAARAIAPGAEVSRIQGGFLSEDGRVDLSSHRPGSWSFTLAGGSPCQAVLVSWLHYSPGTHNPQVISAACNGQPLTLADPSRLADSPAAVSAFAAGGCWPAITESSSHLIDYNAWDRDTAELMVFDNIAKISWTGDAITLDQSNLCPPPPD